MVKLIESKTPRARKIIDYPESDGKPIGETDVHVTAILYLRQALKHLFRIQELLYAAANMLFYYEEGNPHAVRSPDVFVVRGIQKGDRRSYKVWEEGATPCLIIEVTSKKTKKEDLVTKRDLYQRLGVQEYLLFDPLGDYLRPRLQALVLEQGRYVERDCGPEETFFSRQLNLEFRGEGPLLRVIDPKTGPVPTLDELADHAKEVTRRAEVEAARARTEAERARTEAERAKAEAERARAEAERARTAEEEVARLRAELAALRRAAGANE